MTTTAQEGGNSVTMTLKDLNVGESGILLKIDRSGRAYRKRLLAMGLTPGVEFRVVRYAPMGDPVEILVRGFSLSLRKEEAEILIIEKVEHD